MQKSLHNVIPHKSAEPDPMECKTNIQSGKVVLLERRKEGTVMRTLMIKTVADAITPNNML
jgi:hypothetical protein